MGRKTLTIPEEVYEDLDDVNREEESFGDTILTNNWPGPVVVLVKTDPPSTADPRAR